MRIITNMIKHTFKTFLLLQATFLLTTLAFTANSVAAIGPDLGQQAPGFSLENMKNNKTVTLSNLRKKGHVLLVFWSTKCHVCHVMLPQFKAVYKKYKNTKLTLAAINVGYENKEEVADYILQHDVPYLVLNKDKQKDYLAKAYKLVGTPTIKLVNPNGKIIYHGHKLPDLSKYLK